MKKTILISGVVVLFSCQRFHYKTQVIENASSDTLRLYNTSSGETDFIYPGSTYQIGFQDKLGKEEDGILCNDVNDNYELTNIAGDTLLKSLFDEASWASTVTGDKDTEQQCLFTVTDVDISGE